MPRTEHLVLCGGVDGRRRADTKSLRLNLHGSSENVHLKISDIGERLVANIPSVMIDLLEIASYIYAADAAIPRGGLRIPTKAATDSNLIAATVPT